MSACIQDTLRNLCSSYLHALSMLLLSDHTPQLLSSRLSFLHHRSFISCKATGIANTFLCFTSRAPTPRYQNRIARSFSL